MQCVLIINSVVIAYNKTTNIEKFASFKKDIELSYLRFYKLGGIDDETFTVSIIGCFGYTCRLW